MRLLALAALLSLLPVPLAAAPARVISGEHGDFTRLVVYAGPAEGWTAQSWALGRTETGYELRIQRLAEGYDTTAVFARVTRDRLADLVPGAGADTLGLALSCDCHIAPFVVEPGILALDIRDGPAPAGSPHETALDDPAPAEPAPAKTAGPVPAPRSDNPLSRAWVALALGQGTAPQPAPVAGAPPNAPPVAGPAAAGQPPAPPPDDATAPAALSDPGLEPLREALVREISLGAARGVVGMGLPENPPLPAKPAKAPEQARVGQGALPQVRVGVIDQDPVANLAAEGAVCPEEGRLDIARWGDSRPVWEQMAEARSGLTGEFDRLDPEAVARAIRFHLFIGFGQEALGLIQAFDPGSPDRAFWASMAHVLDDKADPAPAFGGLSSCDGPAALWSLMAETADTGPGANFPAVQRAFSALPAAMRQALGPRLIKKLAAAGAESAVQVVANAIRRPGDTGNRDVALMDAGLAADAGEFAAADRLLRPLLDDPGPGTPEATVMLVESHAGRGLPLPWGTLEAISAYAAERAGGPDGQRFGRALTLALALSGEPARAFAEAGGAGEVMADLWRLLTDLGTDDQILDLATLAPGSAAPAAAAGQATRLAERFLNLGLPDQARAWLAGAPEPDRLLAARVAIAQRDGVLAMSTLSGITGAAADELRLAALVLTGEGEQAVPALLSSGRKSEADALLAQAGDWPALRAGGQPHWQAAASALAPPGGPPLAGPLAEGAALADRAAQTRAAVLSLLAAVPGAENLGAENLGAEISAP
ncbi:MAG: hypothetical protein ACT4N9_00920 [Paracoccaceae bacterium]